MVVIALGLPVSLIFQLLVPEDPNANPPKLKWYRWLVNPKFYLVGFLMVVIDTIDIPLFNNYLSQQTACGFVAARYVVILPQTYIPLYYIDTLKMDKVK